MELNDPEDVQRLIRLKRYESPGDEYFRSFSEAFKERQRAELLKQSARGLLIERFSLWFDESGGTKRFVPAGALAAAAIGAGLYLALPGEDSSPTNENFAGVPSVLPERKRKKSSLWNCPRAKFGFRDSIRRCHRKVRACSRLG